MRLLASENVYDRDIAQRLLTERRSPAIRAKLESLVLDRTAVRVARMHALWALVGSGPLEVSFHLALLKQSDQTFRAWGVRAAGNQGKIESSIKERIFKLTTDHPAVRLQLAIAARKLEGVDPMSLLLDVQQASALDPLIPRIVWQNLLPLIQERRTVLTQRLIARKSKAPGLSLLIPRTIEMLLDSGDVDAAVVAKLLFASSDPVSTVESLDLILERLRDHSLPRQVEEAMRTELQTVLKSMIGKPNQVDEFLTVAQAYCGDQASLKQVLTWVRSNEPEKNPAARAETEELRIRALQAILYRQIQGTVRTIVAGILAEDASRSSPEFRERVLEVLSKVDDPEVARAVLSAYPSLSVELKAKAVNLLTHRSSWTKSLLDAIVGKQLPTTVLNVTQLRKLTQSKDPKILSQVKALWGTIRERRDPKRESAAAAIRDMLRKTPGDPIAGEAVFKKTCALCHKIYGDGQNVGPDLTSNGRNDFDSLISNVFDPSLVIGPGYQATTLATTEGRILVGLLVEDGKDRIQLKLQGGQVETIQRSQIAEMKTSELSLMPESFETQLSQQQVADLCAFLCLDKPPREPTARALPGSGPMIRPRK